MPDSTKDSGPGGGLPVVVIGAGPTGLACASTLGRRGIPAVVLEQGDGVGAAWRAQAAFPRRKLVGTP